MQNLKETAVPGLPDYHPSIPGNDSTPRENYETPTRDTAAPTIAVADLLALYTRYESH